MAKRGSREKWLTISTGLLISSSDAMAAIRGGDGGGFIALAIAAGVGWLASRFVGAYFGFLAGLLAFFLAAAFMKYIAAALGIALIACFLYTLFFSNDKEASASTDQKTPE